MCNGHTMKNLKLSLSFPSFSSFQTFLSFLFFPSFLFFQFFLFGVVGFVSHWEDSESPISVQVNYSIHSGFFL